jgi:hypothetical protein
LQKRKGDVMTLTEKARLKDYYVGFEDGRDPRLANVGSLQNLGKART